MQKNNVLFILLTVFSLSLFGQSGSISGKIISNGAGLPYVKVVLVESLKGVVTDGEGRYVFTELKGGDYTLKTTIVGFAPFEQTVTIKPEEKKQVDLNVSEADLQLNTIVVTGTMRETMISNSPVKIEVLNKGFFENNPVNSVIEALQTVNGVQEQVNCGVCGTNDIRINGMEGPYTLVLIDGMPIVSGLSSVYGFNGIPTSLIERVEIIKGPSSTLYGTEAVGGVINIITKSPENSNLVNVETRYNSHNELKTAISFSPQLGKRVFTSLSGDYYYNDYRMDFNEDGFTDIPLNNRISLFNKWQINNKKGEKAFSLGARYLNEDRFGGQLSWTKDDRGSSTVYGESILTKRYEVIGEYIFPVKNRNLKLNFSANQHQQDSYYGDVSYKANQQVFFSNLTLEKKLGKRNFLLGGLSNKYQIYKDNTPSNTDENTYIPGVFAQNEFNWTEDLTLLTGARLDYHQRHGFIFSPRLSIKQTIKDYTALRFNYGTGFRQVYLFTEDHAFVTGARDVVIAAELNPERSHNITLNLNHTYAKGGFGNFDVDLFYTYFSNKIIPDYDVDPNLIVYNNLSGYGITRGGSFAINHKFKSPLSIKLGATFMDVFEKRQEEEEWIKDRQLFAPAFSGVFGINYDLHKWELEFNYSGNITGRQELPEFTGEFSRPTVSEWFTIQNVQITKSFFDHSLEIFCGVKNIFNYTQASPLINPQEPYSDSFDTSYAYGPLQVRRVFFGLRYGVHKKTKK